jgi:hypothetical protein
VAASTSLVVELIRRKIVAILEDAFKGGNIVTGLAIGLGVAILAPAAISLLRPLAKSVIKAGLIAYDQGRAAVAELNARTGDMVTEARKEYEQDTIAPGHS